MHANTTLQFRVLPHGKGYKTMCHTDSDNWYIIHFLIMHATREQRKRKVYRRTHLWRSVKDPSIKGSSKSTHKTNDDMNKTRREPSFQNSVVGQVNNLRSFFFYFSRAVYPPLLLYRHFTKHHIPILSRSFVHSPF